MISLEGAHLGDPAPGHELSHDRVEGRAGARRGVARVERKHQDPAAALGAQLAQGRRDRRLAVGHTQDDPSGGADLVSEAVGDGFDDPFGDHPQRRALRGPDPGVEPGRGPRPGGQHKATQDQPPEQPRQLDHPRVGEELLQIRPHGFGGRRRGRAQLDEQDSDRRHVAVPICSTCPPPGDPSTCPPPGELGIYTEQVAAHAESPGRRYSPSSSKTSPTCCQPTRIRKSLRRP